MPSPNTRERVRALCSKKHIHNAEANSHNQSLPRLLEGDSLLTIRHLASAIALYSPQLFAIRRIHDIFFAHVVELLQVFERMVVAVERDVFDGNVAVDGMHCIAFPITVLGPAQKFYQFAARAAK